MVGGLHAVALSDRDVAVRALRSVAPDDNCTCRKLGKIRTLESLDLLKLVGSRSKLVSGHVCRVSVEEPSVFGIDCVGNCVVTSTNGLSSACLCPSC